jgi:2-polyprenyl-6-hydroxyphenyl methylase/3-demethylubiquinone-9 3-methyltransferase
LTTVNKREIEKFSKLASEWWDPNGKFKPIHKFNPVRIGLIRRKIISHFSLNGKLDQPFKNIKILDIGCGGGLLCEPMKRLGGKITGIDPSKENIKIAKMHAKKMNLKIDYIHCKPEKINFGEKFDVILNMEVVEHVSNVNLFIKNCARFLKKDGIMFIATINKTLKSYLQAIVGAEYVLRWLPIGTHDWQNFISPQELEMIVNKNNFSTLDIIGIKFNPFFDKWTTSLDASVNYVLICSKN